MARLYLFCHFVVAYRGAAVGHDLRLVEVTPLGAVCHSATVIIPCTGEAVGGCEAGAPLRALTVSSIDANFCGSLVPKARYSIYPIQLYCVGQT